MGNDCFAHPLILNLMLLQSQQVHTSLQIGSTFSQAFLPLYTNSQLHTSPNTTPSALFTCPNYINLLCLNFTERSSTSHISAMSLLDLSCSHLTPAMYLSILRSHLHRISIRLLTILLLGFCQSNYQCSNFRQLLSKNFISVLPRPRRLLCATAL